MHRDDRNHQWIKLALKKRRTSLSSIAKRLGVQPSTVCMVSRGVGRSRRIEAAIADVIGFSPGELWPDRYRGEPDDSNPDPRGEPDAAVATLNHAA